MEIVWNFNFLTKVYRALKSRTHRAQCCFILSTSFCTLRRQKLNEQFRQHEIPVFLTLHSTEVSLQRGAHISFLQPWGGERQNTCAQHCKDHSEIWVIMKSKALIFPHLKKNNKEITVLWCYKKALLLLRSRKNSHFSKVSRGTGAGEQSVNNCPPVTRLWPKFVSYCTFLSQLTTKCAKRKSCCLHAQISKKCI